DGKGASQGALPELWVSGGRFRGETPSASTPMPNDSDPLHHTRKMTARLKETIDHLRADIEKVNEPQFKAMFETSAEVLGGLVKAFQDYEKKNENAWTRTQKETRGVAFGP